MCRKIWCDEESWKNFGEQFFNQTVFFSLYPHQLLLFWFDSHNLACSFEFICQICQLFNNFFFITNHRTVLSIMVYQLNKQAELFCDLLLRSNFLSKFILIQTKSRRWHVQIEQIKIIAFFSFPICSRLFFCVFLSLAEWFELIEVSSFTK